MGALRDGGWGRVIYLLVLIGLLGCMALLDARYRLFFWARPAAAAAVMAVGLAYFLAWDVWAIAEGIFLHRDSPLMTGIMLAHQLPLEEAFFLAFLCYQTMILFTGALAWLRRRGPRTAEPAAGGGTAQEARP
ncbi:MAG: lycopene cyclase domain-containing protein [Arthrobacter sp.]|uniref:lycopene cyclase domain-containing protein n=1 Tax=Arthrobacter sp. TaxID=1667 RepID=UPI00347D7C5B